MKYIHKALDGIQQCDLFASNIIVRYKADNDYKTLTSAIISICLIIFFGVVFFRTFVSMLHRDTITSNTLLQDNPDPTLYNTTTATFMFAIALNAIPMNTGNRYFNVAAQQYNVSKAGKNFLNINLQPCTLSQWQRFGPDMITLYQKLNFDQWLCPPPDLDIYLQGKYTSDIFQYIKISLTNCSGIFNGQGCKTDAEIRNYLAANDVFSFNFYFINTILNPGDADPIKQFLDDTNNYAFSSSIGTSCNFFLQVFQMETDNSLLPYNDITTVTGGIAPTQAISSTYPVNLNNGTKASTFFKFYIRKSPLSQYVTRSFQKFDAVLSYIGGLFGLIALVIQLPLSFYNQCCYELSLGTELFNYNHQEQSKDKKQKQMNKIQSDQSIGSIGEKKTMHKIQQFKESEDLHSVDSFNFLKYLLFLPYLGLRKLGFTCKLKSMEPYYRALKETRKQNDILNMLKRLSYLDRASDCLLDEHQRKLLHLFKKENIDDMKEQRSKFKLQKKLSEVITSQVNVEILGLNINPIQREATEYDRIKQSYEILRMRRDAVSKKILGSIDPEIIKQLESEDRISKNQLFDSPDKNLYDINNPNSNRSQQLKKQNERKMRKTSSNNSKNLFYFANDAPSYGQKEVQQHNL